MIISVPSDPGLRRIVLPSIIRISDANKGRSSGMLTLSGTSSRPRKRQLQLDFDRRELKAVMGHLRK